MTERNDGAWVWVRRLLLIAVVGLLCAAPFWVYQAVRHFRNAPPLDYAIPLDTPLGSRPVAGVEESGFLGQEEFNGRPFRWTNGRAVLVVPANPRTPPQALDVDIMVYRPQGTLLQIFVNESKVFDEHIGTGELKKRIDIRALKPGREITIELVSDTFVPSKETKGATDDRTLGVNVRGISLTNEAVAAEK